MSLEHLQRASSYLVHRRPSAKETEVQSRGWPAIARGADHALLLAPDRLRARRSPPSSPGSISLVRLPVDAPPGVRLLYVSPLKALVYDIERNLRAPLVGIANAASRHGGHALRPGAGRRAHRATPRSASARRRPGIPADMLVTTPESLYLMLGSQARETLRSVETTVIVDEIHVMAGSKRGVHLAVSLERLSRLTEQSTPSAWASRPPSGRSPRSRASSRARARPVEIIDASAASRRRPAHRGARGRHGAPDGRARRAGQRAPAVRCRWPRSPRSEGEDDDVPGPMDRPEPRRLSSGLWPVVYPRLLALIREHRSTIVFTNSRLLCERLAQRLNELAGEELVFAHHGSLSHARRHEVEEALKAGRVPGIVATSSLELGIDMGAVDLVVLVESPGQRGERAPARGPRGPQVGSARSGASSRSTGATSSRARWSPSRCSRATWSPPGCRRTASTCSPSRSWPWSRSEESLDGRRPAGHVKRSLPLRGPRRQSRCSRACSTCSRALPVRRLRRALGRAITWDRATDHAQGRVGARECWRSSTAAPSPTAGSTACSSRAGRAPASASSTRRWSTSRGKGDLIILGASTWRIEEITRDQVIKVSPAPGEPGRLPFWHGERPGRPAELGQAGGRLPAARWRCSGADARAWLEAHTAARRPRASATCICLRARAAGGHRRGADRPHARGRGVLPRRARRLAGVHPLALRVRGCTRRGGSRWRRASAARGPTTCRPSGPTTASACGSPTSTSCRPRPSCGPIRTRSRTWWWSSWAARRSSPPGSARTRPGPCCCPSGRPGVASPLWAAAPEGPEPAPASGEPLPGLSDRARDLPRVPAGRARRALALVEVLRKVRSREIRVHEVETREPVAVRTVPGVRLRGRLHVRGRRADRRAQGGGALARSRAPAGAARPVRSSRATRSGGGRGGRGRAAVPGARAPGAARRCAARHAPAPRAT